MPHSESQDTTPSTYMTVRVAYRRGYCSRCKGPIQRLEVVFYEAVADPRAPMERLTGGLTGGICGPCFTGLSRRDYERQHRAPDHDAALRHPANRS